MTSISTSVDVELDPEVAFEVFVDEIDAWYRVDRFTVVDFTRTVAIRFEPHVGGRLMDVHDSESGEGREMGRITVWDAGRSRVHRQPAHRGRGDLCRSRAGDEGDARASRPGASVSR